MGDIIMKRNFLAKTAALALSAAIALSGCGSSSSSEGGSSGGGESSDTIKIGILFSETGSTALSEKTMTNACIMAFDEINAESRLNTYTRTMLPTRPRLRKK